MGPTDCAACGKPLTPQRADARYCSNACRQKHYRQRLTVHGDQIIGRGRPRGGLSEEARQLGVSRQELYRARMMAGLSPEAKDEATHRGLANAMTTLLRAAEQGDPAEQVRVIQEEYIRRLRTPGSHLGPRLKTGV
jgi:DNA-binding phage protein